MRTLVESIFGGDLIEKDIFDNMQFKKWINYPDILWYIYMYWDCSEEEGLCDFYGEEWDKYKPLVDALINELNARCKTIGTQLCTQHNWDGYNMFPERYENIESEAEYNDLLQWAIDEIKSKRWEARDGISKVTFRGVFPKNSSVTEFINAADPGFIKPGRTDGGIFLTNEDTIIVFAFPKGTDKSILKLFNIIR